MPLKRHSSSPHPTPGKRIKHEGHSNADSTRTHSDDDHSPTRENPTSQLLRVMKELAPTVKVDEGAEAVVWWSRMKDLRLRDNRALALASATAQSRHQHLVALHVLSPQDYRCHTRSARRIDFVLRNLKYLKGKLDLLHIPLHVVSYESRKSIPEKIVTLLAEWRTSEVFANIEYEVDELARDVSVVELAAKQSIKATFVHDVCVVPPGQVLTQQGHPYCVFSPWQRNWASVIQANQSEYLDILDPPAPNHSGIRNHDRFSKLFSTPVPDRVQGFELDDDDASRMRKLWPEGEDHAHKRLNVFIKGDKDNKSGAISVYASARDRPDQPGTSRLSPYLAAGVISPRTCLRATLENGKGNLKTDRKDHVGMWVQEVGWRDFYVHVLSAYPHVCRGHNFQQPKYDHVQWEPPDLLQIWKDGRTGYPIIDAGMRQLNHEGWMHNRVRMCVAMFLCKDLMIDWREGERYFAQQLIDHDFASNNGGWQWSSSTGVDPQPYFRIFSPLSQSLKSDPDGDYIRRWIPELKDVPSKAIHEPNKHLSKKELDKLGYPPPCVDHAVARKRALARFKDPGSNADE